MRNVLKYVAVAGFGVAMSMSMAAPSFATTDNVKGAVSYFVDCLKKLGTDQNCGGPHPIANASSITSLSGSGPGGQDCAYWEVLINGYCYCWWEVSKDAE
jgi:hypothetical protein